MSAHEREREREFAEQVDELRRPLDVMATSLYLARTRAAGNRDVVRHLDRLAEQIELTHRIVAHLLELSCGRGGPALRLSRPEPL
jgi:hypothetical protein